MHHEAHPHPADHEERSSTGGRRSTRARRGRRRLPALMAGLGLASGGIVAVGGTAGAIVDGTDTTARANPWQVALVDGEGQFCGGSLVSDRVVVTAAHCVVGIDPADVSVRAGVTDLRTDDGQTLAVSGVIEHPTYVGASADIAMLVLAQPARFDESVAAIPLATPDEAAAATSGRVTGWGALSEQDDGVVNVLQTADVPTVDDGSCDAALGIDADNELCAGGTGTDSCYGDSGGPLTIETDRGRVLAGVTSWGEECGGDTPGVYAEVPAFQDWITDRVAEPDAPLPDRVDMDDLDDEFFEDDVDDGTWIDELWDGEGWDDETDPVDGTGREFDHDAIDELSDDEFETWLDGLSDDAFDRYLDELDELWSDGAEDDWFDDSWSDDDWNEDDWDHDAWNEDGWSDDDWADDEWAGDGWADDDWADDDWSEDNWFDLDGADLDGDGIVQWEELGELLGVG